MRGMSLPRNLLLLLLAMAAAHEVQSKTEGGMREQEFVSQMLDIYTRAGQPLPTNSFCWSIQFDDAIRYQGRLRLFSGDRFWDIEERASLPLQTPVHSEGRSISQSTKMQGNIDAATELDREGSSFLYIKGQQVYFLRDDQTLEREVSLREFLFAGAKGVRKSRGDEDDEEIPIDAAWFSHEANRLFLFSGAKYFELKRRNGSSSEWTLVFPADRLIVSDFKINVNNVDAVFTVADQGIMLRKNWFFVLPLQRPLFPATAYGARLAFGSRASGQGLMDTKEACGLTEEMFADLTDLMDQKFGLIDATERGLQSMGSGGAAGEARDDGEGSGTQGPVEAKERSLVPYFVVLALIAVLLAVSVYFICCRKSAAATTAGALEAPRTA